MVLRALLRRHEGELTLFRGSAARAGFAQELGAQLAELQQHGLGPTKLRDLADARETGRELAAKLRDISPSLWET